MTALTFAITDARPAPDLASPAILFRLSIARADGGAVHAVALRCHVRIDARGRRYAPEEQARLYELFGQPSQWDRTLHSVTWGLASIVVPTFDARTEVEVPVPCTYDLEVASAKYLHAVREGDIPLTFLFSGTAFIVDESRINIEPVPWDLEASFRMPASVWRAAMDRFFPGGGWVRLETATLDKLQAFRGRHALVTWDSAIERLLAHADQQQPI